MSVQKGAPEFRSIRKVRRPEVKEVVAAAAAEPGEWFSIELDGMKPESSYGILASAVGRHFAEFRRQGDRIFIRVKPS